ncbi:MAG: pseudaminic acid cytidylyltransferase, partial [Planctomycetota bacterium]
RIPRKNIRAFCGRPMLAWSIAVLHASNLFDSILVSTDDEEVGKIAREYGAEVPFFRPHELADDHTPTIPVVNHALAWYEDHFSKVDTVVCCYATAPFLQAIDVQAAVDCLEENSQGLDYVFPMAEYPHPIERALQRRGNLVRMRDPDMASQRSQDLQPAYHDAGQFYAGCSLAWREQRPIFGDKSSGILLPRCRVVDIDTMDDWQLAELLFRAQGLGNDL